MRVTEYFFVCCVCLAIALSSHARSNSGTHKSYKGHSSIHYYSTCGMYDGLISSPSSRPECTSSYDIKKQYISNVLLFKNHGLDHKKTYSHRQKYSEKITKSIIKKISCLLYTSDAADE